MGTSKEDVIRLLDITESIGEIEGYLGENTTYRDLSGLENVRDAIMAELAQIGGAAALLSDTFKEEHNEVDWDVLKSLQYTAEQEHLELDLHSIYYIVKEDLPAINNTLIDLIATLQDDEDLDALTLNEEDKAYIHNRYVEKEDVLDFDEEDIRYEDTMPSENLPPLEEKEENNEDVWIETTQKKRKGPFHP